MTKRGTTSRGRGVLAIVAAALGSCAGGAPITREPKTPEPPEAVTMTGLPIHLSGWNGVYRKTSSEKNGKPVWARPAHYYLGSLPLRIIGVTIWFDGEAWVLQRDGDRETQIMARSMHGGDSPVGDWEAGYVKVSRTKPQKEPNESR